jgi:hypothetical protein
MLAQDLEQAYRNAIFDYLPKGAARSPSSDARVRTSGFPDQLTSEGRQGS